MKDLIFYTCNIIIENEELLTDLDIKIGDGDHGLNMKRGCENVKIDIENFDSDESSLLMKVSMSLLSKVGGASGPLYGTVFMNLSKSYKNKSGDLKEFLNSLFDTAIDGIKLRGKAEKGEKTMLDTLIPASEAFKSEKDIKLAYKKAIKSAEIGMKSTKDMIATKGRASYLGERSKGTIDPGSCSMYLILESIGKYYGVI